VSDWKPTVIKFGTKDTTVRDDGSVVLCDIGCTADGDSAIILDHDEIVRLIETWNAARISTPPEPQPGPAWCRHPGRECGCGSAPGWHLPGTRPDCEYYTHHCESCHAKGICTAAECTPEPQPGPAPTNPREVSTSLVDAQPRGQARSGERFYAFADSLPVPPTGALASSLPPAPRPVVDTLRKRLEREEVSYSELRMLALPLLDVYERAEEFSHLFPPCNQDVWNKAHRLLADALRKAAK
jgi:hypothetical protein